MKRTIASLLDRYSPTDLGGYKSALREMAQSIVLVGLSKGGFFEKASFYGGTALRIFHRLDRFSEDLDFTLNGKDEGFSLDAYFPSIRSLGESYGMDFSLSIKSKAGRTPVESAFAKLNTYEAFISMEVRKDMVDILHRDEVLKVKFEVDTDPAPGFASESKWTDFPEFAPVSVLDMPSLFAGKIHAILCRNYKGNVKGRDYYDFLFHIRQRTKPNMAYLRNKLVQSGKLGESDAFDLDILKKLLEERFRSVDFEKAKSDANLFLRGSEDLSYFSADMFVSMLDRL